MKLIPIQIHRYIGLIASAPTGVPVGSTLYDYATGIMHITYDGTNWAEKDTVVRLETSPTINIGDVDVLSLPSITTLTHAEVSVGTGSTTTLAANASRVYALFQNDSTETIYIYLGATAVLNKGIRLAASGGSYEITTANLYKGIVKSICTTGTKNLLVTEGV